MINIFFSNNFIVRDDYLLLSFREFLQEKNTNFRNIQRLAIETILKKVNCITIISDTNSNKFLVYLFTAFFSTSKTTIVFIPLIALKKDIYRRAIELSIDISIYEEDKEKISFIVLVSIETISNFEFFLYLKKLEQLEKLDRIIFDEAYLIVTNVNYRFHIHSLKRLRIFVTQFVFFSITLPDLILSELEKSMILIKNVVLRTFTIRDNISYRIKVFSKNIKEENERFEKVLKTLIDLIVDFEVSDRIIIFVINTNTARKLSEYLDCKYYASNVENKEKIIDSFIFFDRIIVATSALEEGFDYSFIRVVIHYISSFSFIDFQQQTGRAERDQKHSISLTLIMDNELKYNDRDDDFKTLYKEYLNESIYKRRIINRVFDNEINDTCITNQNPCDLCLARNLEKISEIESYKEKTMENSIFEEDFINDLNFVEENCLICYLYLNAEYSHYYSICSMLKNFPLQKSIDLLRTPNLLPKDSCCFNCFLPTSICKKLKNFEFETDCVHEEIIPLLYCIIFSKQDIYSLDNLLSKDLRKDFERGLISLARKKVKLFNIDSNGLIELFIYIIKLRRTLII